MSGIIDGFSAFLARNRTKLIVTTGVVGGIYYSFNLLKNKLVDLQTSFSQSSWSQRNIIERYDMNLNLSRHTVINLLSELEENITSSINIESMFQELRTMSQKPIDQTPDVLNPDSIIISENKASNYIPTRTKIEIWEDIKNQSFIRLVVSEYSLTILTLLIHVQLSIIGQTTYSESVAKKFGLDNSNDVLKSYMIGQTYTRNSDEQNFLLLSWWILNRGWKIIKEKVELSVTDKIKSISIKSKLTYEEFCSTIFQINDVVLSNGFLDKVIQMCLPTSETEYDDFLQASHLSSGVIETEKYHSFMKQAMDILESQEVERILNSQLVRVNRVFLENMKSSFPVKEELKLGIVELNEPEGPDSLNNNKNHSGSSIELSINEFEQYLEVPDPKVGLVKLLPRIVNESKFMLNDEGNIYVKELCDTKEIQALSASIFTARPSS